MEFQIDSDFLIETLRNLVQINSINPKLVADGPGEEEIAHYIAEVFREFHLEPDVVELDPGRFNVVAVLKGAGEGRSLMFNGHMDTVGVQGMTAPFSAEIRHGRLYGRGSQDMKGGLAAMLAAAKALVECGIGLSGDVIFAAVADEEYASTGTEALVKSYRPDAAIVTEPTDLDVCLAHRGFAVFEIVTRGRAAHGSRYQEGVDANLHMGRILAELDKYSRDLLHSGKHPLLGPPSLHVPLIKGGTELFIYANECKVSVERRTLPGEDPEKIRTVLEDILSRAAAGDGTFHAEISPGLHRNPYEISIDAEIVQFITQIASQVLGKRPAYIGHHWWEDSALIAEAGTETVIFGPKGAGIHTHEEWVDIQSVVDLAGILTRTAYVYCG
jgi:acetylornithine deacetylase